jgi:hypothetical protein
MCQRSWDSKESKMDLSDYILEMSVNIVVTQECILEMMVSRKDWLVSKMDLQVNIWVRKESKKENQVSMMDLLVNNLDWKVNKRDLLESKMEM